MQEMDALWTRAMKVWRNTHTTADVSCTNMSCPFVCGNVSLPTTPVYNLKVACFDGFKSIEGANGFKPLLCPAHERTVACIEGLCQQCGVRMLPVCPTLKNKTKFGWSRTSGTKLGLGKTPQLQAAPTDERTFSHFWDYFKTAQTA